MTRRQRQDIDASWASAERTTFTDDETEKVNKRQPVAQVQLVVS